MRLANLILALVLAPVLAVQSILVVAGGSLTSDKDLTSGGDVGILVALLWIVGAAFVMAKPKVSVWLFAIAALVAVLGGSSGFSDLYIWSAVSVGFALLSWGGTKEKAKKASDEDSKRLADIAAAVAMVHPQPVDHAPRVSLPPAPLAPPIPAHVASNRPEDQAATTLWQATDRPLARRADVPTSGLPNC